MQFENALIARICHDLITPFNAINIGVEAFEMSQDASLLKTVKESTKKANAILTFVRELFSEKSSDFAYTSAFLTKQISDFLSCYRIGVQIKSSKANISVRVGRIVLYLAMVSRDAMPFGGELSVQIFDTEIICECVGRSLKPINLSTEEATSRNIFHQILRQLLTQANYKPVISQSDDRLAIHAIFNQLYAL